MCRPPSRETLKRLRELGQPVRLEPHPVHRHEPRVLDWPPRPARSGKLPGEPASVATALAWWKRDHDLAGVRDRIDALPEAEREGWRRFWADVDEALAKARK